MKTSKQCAATGAKRSPAALRHEKARPQACTSVSMRISPIPSNLRRPAEDGKGLEAVFNLAKDDELILTRRQPRLGGAVCKANLAKLRVPSEIAGTRQANRVFGLARSDMEGPGTHHHIAAPRNVNDWDGQGQVREESRGKFPEHPCRKVAQSRARLRIAGEFSFPRCESRPIAGGNTKSRLHHSCVLSNRA